jgi:hypothetical protein
MNDTIRCLSNCDLKAQHAPGESIFDWCSWDGGEMPVPWGVLIDIGCRDGVSRTAVAGEGMANRIFWRHANDYNDIVRYRLRKPLPTSKDAEPALKPPKHSHYFKECPFYSIDVYRVLSLFNVSDPCLQHAVKKLLVAGGRGGGKTIDKDIQEAIDTLVRWQGMRAEEAAL